MFALFVGSSQRIIAGILFEGIVHKALTGGDDSVSLPKKIHRLQYHGGQERRYNFGQPTTANICQIPSDLQVFYYPPGRSNINVLAETYYKPDYPNHPTSDSFLVDKSGRLTLIQITVSPEHSIKCKWLNTLQGRLQGITAATNKKRWRIVFVVPKGQENDFWAWADQKQWVDKLEVFVLPLENPIWNSESAT